MEDLIEFMEPFHVTEHKFSTRSRATWWKEFYVIDMRGFNFMDEWSSDSLGKCWTNIRVLKRCVEEKRAGTKFGPLETVPCSVSKGRGERRDLTVWMCELGHQYLHRIGAFVHLNDRGLSWKEFNIVYQSGPFKGKHKWHVDHLEDPRVVDLDRLEIVLFGENARRYQQKHEQHLLYAPGYTGRPMTMRKRPASAMPTVLKRPAMDTCFG